MRSLSRARWLIRRRSSVTRTTRAIRCPIRLRSEVESVLASKTARLLEPGRLLTGTSRGSYPVAIGRYQVVRLIGRGGMGEVYLARDPVLDRDVAVKLINEDVDTPRSRQRLVQEARAAGRLHHPNIVTVFDAGEHEDQPFIAMEFVRGETLGRLIRRRAPMPLARRLELIEHACAGLAHAHRAGVVHLDIKPDNLMLDETGVVKVLDFGIARVMKTDLLVTRQLGGTLRYMSPEQIDNRPLDRRSDVFSLGCALFELVTFVPAFVGSTKDIVTQISGGPVPGLREAMPGLDPRLDAIARRAMALDPAERYGDLDELRAELAAVRRDMDPAYDPRCQAARIGRRGRRQRADNARLDRPRHVLFVRWAPIPLATTSGIDCGRGPHDDAGCGERLLDASSSRDRPRRGGSSDPPRIQRIDRRVELQQLQRQRRHLRRAAPRRRRRPTLETRSSRPAAPRAEPQRSTAVAPPAAEGPAQPGQPPPSSVDGARREQAGERTVAGAPENVPVAPTPARRARARARADRGVSSSTRPPGPRCRARHAAAVPSGVPRARRQRPPPGVPLAWLVTRPNNCDARSHRSRQYEVEIRNPQIDVQGDTAIVRAELARRMSPRVGNPVTNEVQTEFRLRREGSIWLIAAVTAR